MEEKNYVPMPENVAPLPEFHSNDVAMVAAEGRIDDDAYYEAEAEPRLRSWRWSWSECILAPDGRGSGEARRRVGAGADNASEKLQYKCVCVCVCVCSSGMGAKKSPTILANKGDDGRRQGRKSRAPGPPGPPVPADSSVFEDDMVLLDFRLGPSQL